jgi:HPP family
MTGPVRATAEVTRAREPGIGEQGAHPPSSVVPQVAHYLGLARAIEVELRDAFILVSERHERNYEIARGATTLAIWSTDHITWLEPHIARYGSTTHDGPTLLRSALLGGSRGGVVGELADIADLAVLVEQASMAWTILFQGAKELRDKALLEVAGQARDHSRRQLAWLRTQIEHEAPDAIAVAHDAGGQARISLPKRPNALASIPDPIWGPIVGGALLLGVGALGLLVGKPWLLPSLGPTAVLLAVSAAHPTARPWNVFVGHLGGLLAGFAGVLLLGAQNAPVVLTDGELVPARVLAAAIAVALTILIGDLLRASHPPAAATALLVALGSIETFEKALWVVAGAAAIAVLGELARRLRIERRVPSERRAPAGSVISTRLGRRPAARTVASAPQSSPDR